MDVVKALARVKSVYDCIPFSHCECHELSVPG